MTLWDSFQNWRARRSVLHDLTGRQRSDEAALMDQNLNPINLAKLSLDIGENGQAVYQWERARLLVPNAILQSPDSLEILLGLKRYDEADLLMRERGRKIPGDRYHLTGLARIAEQRGDSAEALKRWTIVRRRVRDTVEGELGRARCLFALDRLEQAESQWNSALRRDPENIHAWVGRARVTDQRKDWTESLSRWKHIAETFKYTPAFAFAAKALAELDRVDEAEAWLEKPSRLYTSDLEIAVTRSHLAQRRGDLPAACDRWARVRSNSPWYQGGYHEGAHRLSEAGRHAEADEVLRAAIERFPDEVWPLFNYARQAHDRQEWPEAAMRWEAFHRRFPAENAAADALRATAQGSAP